MPSSRPSTSTTTRKLPPSTTPCARPARRMPLFRRRPTSRCPSAMGALSRSALSAARAAPIAARAQHPEQSARARPLHRCRRAHEFRLAAAGFAIGIAALPPSRAGVRQQRPVHPITSGRARPMARAVGPCGAAHVPATACIAASNIPGAEHEVWASHHGAQTACRRCRRAGALQRLSGPHARQCPAGAVVDPPPIQGAQVVRSWSPARARAVRVCRGGHRALKGGGTSIRRKSSSAKPAYSGAKWKKFSHALHESKWSTISRRHLRPVRLLGLIASPSEAGGRPARLRYDIASNHAPTLQRIVRCAGAVSTQPLPGATMRLRDRQRALNQRWTILRAFDANVRDSAG